MLYVVKCKTEMFSMFSMLYGVISIVSSGHLQKHLEFVVFLTTEIKITFISNVILRTPLVALTRIIN